MEGIDPNSMDYMFRWDTSFSCNESDSEISVTIAPVGSDYTFRYWWDDWSDLWSTGSRFESHYNPREPKPYTYLCPYCGIPLKHTPHEHDWEGCFSCYDRLHEKPSKRAHRRKIDAAHPRRSKKH
jgi:hypothetical protein